MSVKFIELISGNFKGDTFYIVKAPGNSASMTFETKEDAVQFAKKKCTFYSNLKRDIDLRIYSAQLTFIGVVRDCFDRGKSAAPKDLNAGQRPGLVGCASTPPAGGARHSAFNAGGRKCAK